VFANGITESESIKYLQEPYQRIHSHRLVVHCGPPTGLSWLLALLNACGIVKVKSQIQKGNGWKNE
jgi:hypothetical protein